MHLVDLAIAGSTLLLTTALALGIWRSMGYRALRERLRTIERDLGRQTYLLPAATVHTPPPFADRLANIRDVLQPESFETLRAEVEHLSTTERSYVPTHKKGGTVAYETLCADAPQIVGLYLSPDFHKLISGIVGVKVVPTPLHDQSSCSVLFYERPGDHIGWHFDYNFYQGRHFTVLLPLVNRDATGSGLSAARLHARINDEDRVIETPPNSLVVFEGARVLHKATPIEEGERRIVLSMTFATDPRNTITQGIARRFKDTAFFGIRALWT